MFNPCWSNIKRFLSVLAVFGKSFVFAKKKKSKFQKTMLPCIGDSVAGWSSREKYLEYFSKFGFLIFLVTQSGDLFAGGRSSREKAQRFSWLTSWLSHGQNFQSWKTLRKIFQNFCLECSGDVLATWLSCENRVFCIYKSVFKCFQFLPRTFLTVHCLPYFKHL